MPIQSVSNVAIAMRAIGLTLESHWRERVNDIIMLIERHEKYIIEDNLGKVFA